MDIAIAINYIVENARYSGDLSLGTEQQFNNLLWMDDNEKPSWSDILIAHDQAVLDSSKTEQKDIVLACFETAAIANVNALGTEWVGGYVSGIKIDAKKRLSLEMGMPAVLVHDALSNAHALNYNDATTVVHSIGYDYEIKFAKKSALLTAIDSVTLDGQSLEDALAVIKNIIWS